MSTITIFMGRPTTDPVIQQGKNNGSEYASLDLGVTQRGQNNENETVFYNCYFGGFLAQRLINAGVKKGSCLQITGTMDVHSFMYSKGQKAGQPGVSVNIRVLDWQFAISNKEQGAAPNGNVPGNAAVPNGTPSPGNGSMIPPNGGGYQNPGMANGGPVNAAGIPNNGNITNGNAAVAGVPYNGMIQGTFAGNGFAGIPEGMPLTLPFGN